MYLQRLSISNFRCYEHIEFDDLGRIGIFIGENDAGKTSVLDAIEILLTGKASERALTAHDFYRRPGGEPVEKITLGATFQLDEFDSALPDEFRSGFNNDLLVLRREILNQSSTLLVVCQDLDPKYGDATSATGSKEVLNALGIEHDKKHEVRLEQIRQAKASGTYKLIEQAVKVVPNSPLNQFLPQAERIASSEYEQPERVVQRVLKDVANSVIFTVDAVNGKSVLRHELLAVQSELMDRAANEISKAEQTLRGIHPDLRRIEVQPLVDFSRAITTYSLNVECEDGMRPYSSFGQGTKKKLWLGLLAWERLAPSTSSNRSVLRLYDEPDANLDYNAQRMLFSNIKSSCAPGTRTQCFVCTHSTTLIDQASLDSINLVSVNRSNRERTCERFRANVDAAIDEFLRDVGSAVGLTNTALLYERAFLLVEGVSDKSIVDIVYSRLYGKTPREDGIRIVQLGSCGGWSSVVTFLLQYRSNITHMLFDSDCKLPDSHAKITRKRLSAAGCSDTFLDLQVTFVGNKEIEDTFGDELLCDVLNDNFPREDGANWEIAHLDALRLSLHPAGSKFSDKLPEHLRQVTIKENRTNVSKDTIARGLATKCPREALPKAVLAALNDVRNRALIETLDELEIANAVEQAEDVLVPRAVSVFEA